MMHIVLYRKLSNRFCNDRYSSMDGWLVTVWPAKQLITPMILTNWSLQNCAGGITSANSQNSWILSSLCFAKSSTRSPTCMSSTTASCQPLYGGVLSSHLVAMPLSLACSTLPSMSSCIPTTFWLPWVLSIRNTCGGRSTWPPCRWSSSSWCSSTVFRFSSTAAISPKSLPTPCASTPSYSSASSPTSTFR